SDSGSIGRRHSPDYSGATAPDLHRTSLTPLSIKRRERYNGRKKLSRRNFSGPGRRRFFGLRAVTNTQIKQNLKFHCVRRERQSDCRKGLRSANEGTHDSIARKEKHRARSRVPSFRSRISPCLKLLLWRS